MSERPTGVTILAVLSVIGGILTLAAGGFMAFLGPAIATEAAKTGQALPEGAGPFYMILGGSLLVLGVLYLITAYGLFTLRRWAWLVAVVVQVLSIISNGVQLVQGHYAGIGAIAIAAGILYYLMRPHVKAAFGRA